MAEDKTYWKQERIKAYFQPMEETLTDLLRRCDAAKTDLIAMKLDEMAHKDTGQGTAVAIEIIGLLFALLPGFVILRTSFVVWAGTKGKGLAEFANKVSSEHIKFWLSRGVDVGKSAEKLSLSYPKHAPVFGGSMSAIIDGFRSSVGDVIVKDRNFVRNVREWWDKVGIGLYDSAADMAPFLPKPFPTPLSFAKGDLFENFFKAYLLRAYVQSFVSIRGHARIHYWENEPTDEKMGWSIDTGLTQEHFEKIKRITGSLPDTLSIDAGSRSEVLQVGTAVGKITSVLDLNYKWHCASEKRVDRQRTDPRGA